MKTIFIKELNSLFVFFNKSGSLVFINTLTDFCLYRNYTYENIVGEIDNVDIDYFLKKSGNKKDNFNIYFFIRNPYERFLTSFIWYMNNYKNYKSKIKDLDDENLYSISNLEKFLKEQKTILNLKDTHFLPQKYSIFRTFLGRKNEFIIDKNLMDEYFYNYEIIKIEEFKYDINEFMFADRGGMNIKRQSDETIKLVRNICSSSFLNNLDDFNFKLFSILFYYNSNLLDKHHHNKMQLKVPEKLETEIQKYLNDELELYGYPFKKTKYKKII